MGLALVAAAAQASTEAYRCTDAQGQVQYSQQPCGSQAHKLEGLADPRTAQQQREAQHLAERDHALAHNLTQERKRLERHAAQQSPGNLSPTRKAKPARTADPHAPVPIEHCGPPACYGTTASKRQQSHLATPAKPAASQP